MPYKIEHWSSLNPELTATSSPATSPKVHWGSVGGGMIFVTGVDGGATTLTWYAATSPTATPVPVIDGGNNVTTTVVADRAYYVPDSLFAAPFVVAVTNAGTVTFVMAAKG